MVSIFIDASPELAGLDRTQQAQKKGQTAY